MSTKIRACSALAIVLVSSIAFSCSKSSNDGPASDPNVDNTGNSTLPTEWVGFHTEIPLADPTTFHALASGLVGPDAQSGKAISHKELDKGIYIDTDADKTTPDQIDLTISFDAGEAFPRKLAVAPASFGVGNVFVAAADAALAKMQADNAAKPGSGETFYIEYRVYSSQGGRL